MAAPPARVWACLQDALGNDAGLWRAVDGLRREEEAEVLRVWTWPPRG